MLLSSMRKPLYIFFSLFLCGQVSLFSHPTPIGGELTTPRNVQILVEDGVNAALLEVKGPYYLFNPEDGSVIARGLLEKRFMVHQIPDKGLKWGELFEGIHQFYVQPRSKETTIFVNGVQYSGSLAVYGISGNIYVVNDLSVESFVKAFLSTHFTSPLEPEVLSALAILARTNAYHHALKGEHRFWHMKAHDIGYGGEGLVVKHSLIDKAVDSTCHLILVHPKEGKTLPFATTWTEHSGGKTVPYHVLFRKEGRAPEQGVDAPHAFLSREQTHWHSAISKKEFCDLFAIPQIASIDLFKDPSSAKVYGVRLKVNSDDVRDIDFLCFQEKLGSSRLSSSEFSVSSKDKTIHFEGYGKGNGVGLCLYSASAMAQNGENAVQILSKFFPETYLYNINALPKGIQSGDE